MKKIVLVAAFAVSAVFAETAAVEVVKDAAAAEAKSAVIAEVKEAVTDAVSTEENASEVETKTPAM